MKPTLHHSSNSILEEKRDDTQLAKTIKHHILEYLNNKYSDRETQAIFDIVMGTTQKGKKAWTQPITSKEGWNLTA